MKSHVIVLSLILFFGINTPSAFSEEITIVFLERPPYYFTEFGTVKGILAELTDQLFNRSGITHTWKSLPPKRIITLFESSDLKICSPGWFIKPEREVYANFSHAIYQNNPLAFLILKRDEDKFAKYDSLDDLLADQSVIMGTVATYRYSDFLDEMISRYQTKQIQVYSSPSQIPRLMIVGRADYMILSPVEKDTLLEKAGLNPDDFSFLTFPNIPKGNKRFLMCSKTVSPSTMTKINAAIKQIVDQSIWLE